jgi:hypothetical protein
MTADEKQKLEIALGFDQPIPWAETIAQEVELEEMRLAADMHGPSRMRKSGEVSKVLDILDSLDSGKDGRK